MLSMNNMIYDMVHGPPRLLAVVHAHPSETAEQLQTRDEATFPRRPGPPSRVARAPRRQLQRPNPRHPETHRAQHAHTMHPCTTTPDAQRGRAFTRPPQAAPDPRQSRAPPRTWPPHTPWPLSATRCKGEPTPPLAAGPNNHRTDGA